MSIEKIMNHRADELARLVQSGEARIKQTESSSDHHQVTDVDIEKIYTKIIEIYTERLELMSRKEKN